MNEFDSIIEYLEPRWERLAKEEGIPYREMQLTMEDHRLFENNEFAELEKRFLRHLRGATE